MANLGMTGPFKLDIKSITDQIAMLSPGNYALGYEGKEGQFVVQYVGRSDNDLKDRLLQHAFEDCPLFEYSYATSSQAAFDKEWENYHDFGGSEGKLKNDRHPQRPDNSKWKCPKCKILVEPHMHS